MMQRTQDREEVTIDLDPVRSDLQVGAVAAPRSCYGVQVLVAGRRKQWRDEINGQIRRGYSAISVDSAVDALTVLVLGLPVDVLVTDAELHGALGLSELAAEARALRPNLGIVVACDSAVNDCADLVPADALLISSLGEEEAVASSVREAMAARAG